MHPICRCSLWVLALLALPVTSGATREPVDPGASSDQYGMLQHAIATRLDGLPHAGLSVAVSHRDEEWFANFGFRQIERREPATSDTRYRLASVTKMITAVAILQLVEQGAVQLDDDIRTYLPTFPAKAWPVTIRQLLGHLAGISHYKDCRRECHLKTPHTTEQALRIFRSWPLEHEPGSRYLYTSYGYNLLGAIIEQVSGQSYVDFLQEHVFAPSHMTSTNIDSLQRRGPRDAQGYVLYEDKLVPSEPVDVTSRFAGGGLRASPTDMLSFGRALLRGDLLSEATLELMQTSMATTDGVLTDYGMGAAVYPQSGRYVVAHAGSQPETSTYLVLVPAEQLVIFLATNLEEQWPLLREVVEMIISHRLGDGSIRRLPTGADDVHTLVIDALFGTFGHGAAYFTRFQHPHPTSLTRLLRGFHDLTEMLTPAQLKEDVMLARRRERLADDPVGGKVYAIVGSHMASVIARVHGAARLRVYASTGPIGFLLDYEEACDISDCPNGLRFPQTVVDNFAAKAAAYARADHTPFRHRRIPRDLSGRDLRSMLEPAWQNAAFHPDFSRELIALADAHHHRGALADAADVLAFATESHPSLSRVWWALLNHRLRNRYGEDVSAILERWQSLSESSEEEQARTLLALARTLRAEGHDDSSRTLLENSCALLPKDNRLARACARWPTSKMHP